MSSTQVPSKSQSARRPPAPPVSVRPEDRGRFFLTAALWALAVLVMAGLAYKRLFAQPAGPGFLTDPDAMDYAQIARNLATHHGYATGILRPLAVTGIAPPDHSGVAPDVTRAPLYPFLLMIVFLAHGGRGGDSAVIGVSLALFLLTVLAVYRLARVLFPAPDQVWVALLSAGLYGVGGEALGFALLGQPVTLATLLLTLLLIALYRSAEAPGRPATPGSALLAGVLLGLCYLTQYSLLLLALPVLLYVFFSRAPQRAWVGVGACLLGFSLIAGGWMVRNATISHGNPFYTQLFYGVMANTPAYPGAGSIYRSVPPQAGPLEYFYTHLPDMFARAGVGLSFYRDHLLQAFNVFLLAAAVASLFWRAPDARLNAVRACAAVGAFSIVLVTSFFQPTVQMIAPFAPLVTVVAVGFVFSLVAGQDWDPFLQRVSIWGLGLLVGLGAFWQFSGQKPFLPAPTAQGLEVLTHANLTPIDNPAHLPGSAVITDDPWEVAWRADVPAIWLPADNDAYQRVAEAADQSKVPITASLLTPALDAGGAEFAEAAPWKKLVRLADAYDPDAIDQVPDPVWKRTHDKQLRDAQYKIYAKAVAAHDPRVKQYTQSSLQQTFGQAKDNIDAKYQIDYGLITNFLADFQPAAPVQEYDGRNSLLFQRRGAAK